MTQERGCDMTEPQPEYTTEDERILRGAAATGGGVIVLDAQTLPAIMHLAADALAHQREIEAATPPAPPLPEGVTLDGPEGYCPVQAYGTVDGFAYYFRARWDGWSFEVSFDPHADICADETAWREDWWVEEEYANASWMPHADAVRCIVEAVGRFRAERQGDTDGRA